MPRVRRRVLRQVLRQWSVLARYPDFAKLFAGTTTSAVGSSVGAVALPLTAVLVLDASPFEMGVLGAVSFLPHLVLGLPAGVWIGRISYRRTVVIADVARVLLFGAIPLLAVLDVLAIWQLYVIVLLAGVCMLFETVAATSYLPSLVGRDDLLQANGVLTQSGSVVNTTGSAVGGVLVQLLTAPVAILVDAVSFLVAAICKRTIRVPGRPQARTSDAGSPPQAGPSEAGSDTDHLGSGTSRRLWHEIADGLRTVFGDRVLRPLILSATIGALTGQIQNVVLVLFLARDLELSPSLVGIAIAAGGIASILGAMLAPSITERHGHGPTFIAGSFLAAVSGFALTAAAGPLPLVLVVLFIARVFGGLAPPLYSINQTTIRQALAPPEMLDRVNATWRFMVFGTQPIGALLGGVLGGIIGLRWTFVLASLGAMLAVAIAFRSPLRGFRRLPDPGPDKSAPDDDLNGRSPQPAGT